MFFIAYKPICQQQWISQKQESQRKIKILSHILSRRNNILLSLWSWLRLSLEKVLTILPGEHTLPCNPCSFWNWEIQSKEEYKFVNYALKIAYTFSSLGLNWKLEILLCKTVIAVPVLICHTLPLVKLEHIVHAMFSEKI